MGVRKIRNGFLNGKGYKFHEEYGGKNYKL